MLVLLIYTLQDDQKIKTNVEIKQYHHHKQIQKKVVCQCLSINNINIAAAKTGVTIANIRIVNKSAIVINGINTRLFLNPGIPSVLLVINKFVNDMVVVTPAKITDTINKSWLPKPVYFVFEEKGVIKVHPATVNDLLEHFVK